MAENEKTVPQFSVQRIYVRDMSFESSMGAEIFTKQWQPQVKVDLNSKANKLNDESYEVVLTVTVTATLDDETAFLVEVQQAGMFAVVGLEGDQLNRALGIMCPNLLFPYLREVVDGATVKGGFPPIGLQPVNFEALYLQSQQRQAQETVEKASGAH